MAESIRVLHVDDNAEFVSLSSMLLERRHESISVETETDPRNIVERLADGPDHIDCIVSDYEMPFLDGLELLECIREHRPDLPFILFTGKGSEEIAAEAISKGVDDYMQKETGTDHYEVLASRIQTHVQRVRTERALQNNESMYRALVDQNIVGIYLIKEDEFTYVNPRLEEIFGYDRGELIGTPPLVIVDPSDKERVRENLRKRLEGETASILYHFTGLRDDGKNVEILAQGRAIQFDGNPAVAGILLDVDQLESPTSG